MTFLLVQETYLKDELNSLRAKENRVAEIATYWEDALHSLKGTKHVIDIRNLGLIGAIELEPILEKPSRRAYNVLCEAFRDQKFLSGSSGVVEGHAYHLYVLEVKDRLGLYNHLREKQIYAQIHYVPTHLMPYYKQFGWEIGDFPNAEAYYEKCISLPMYPTLTRDEQKYVIETIKEYYG